jgi:hypothetical protein
MKSKQLLVTAFLSTWLGCSGQPPEQPIAPASTGGRGGGTGGASNSGGSGASSRGGNGGSASGTGGGSGGATGSGGSNDNAGSGGSTSSGGSNGSDAAPAAPTPSAGALETVTVPAGGAAVTTKTTLATGEVYLLKATGAVDLGGMKVDAEYGFGTGMPADEAGGVDLGVDIGEKQIHPKVHTTPTPPGPGRMKWGAAGATFREDHVYYMLLTGAGKALTLKLTGPTSAQATGGIDVSIFQLSPTPPKALGTELETVMVPLLKVQVATTMTLEAGKPYILQASGTGKVSKGGFGDAEYMDYDAEGTKYNEGESGADFGIGVDELDVGVRPGGGATYKQRLRWWGPWRKDHTYYMVFTGTGKPLQLLYFDSGYGDNGAEDKLPLKVFAAP